MIRHPVFVLGLLGIFLLGGVVPAVGAPGDEGGSPAVREAAKHFQRGVTLYSEADYQGALVEFQRTYALAPNQVVLYNVGETQYQLRDYAGALSTFERYLADAGPADPHRAQVESNIKVLRSRVGHLTIVTIPPGAEISIDDRAIGRTPFERPIVVGVGHLKVTGVASGRPPATRYVDVAAEDSAAVTLDLSPVTVVKAAAPAPQPAVVEEVPSTPANRAAWRTAGWITTGVLAAGALVVGALAYRQSNDLQSARDQYPAMAGVLSHKANVTRNLSLVADSLAVAALIVGGVTLYSTLGANSGTETRVVAGFGSIFLNRTF